MYNVAAFFCRFQTSSRWSYKLLWMSVVSFFVDYCCCNYSFVGPVRIRFFVSLLFFFSCVHRPSSFYILISTTIYFCTRMRNGFWVRQWTVELSDECCLREVVSIVRHLMGWGGSEESIKGKRQCHNGSDFRFLTRFCVWKFSSYHLETISQYIITLVRLVSHILIDAVVLAHEKARMLRRLPLEYHPMTLKSLLYITSRRFPAFKFKRNLKWRWGEVAGN